MRYKKTQFGAEDPNLFGGITAYADFRTGTIDAFEIPYFDFDNKPKRLFYKYDPDLHDALKAMREEAETRTPKPGEFSAILGNRLTDTQFGISELDTANNTSDPRGARHVLMAVLRELDKRGLRIHENEELMGKLREDMPKAEIVSHAKRVARDMALRPLALNTAL